MDNTQQIIKKQLNTLPSDIKKAILSVDLREKLKMIAEKNNFHIDQAGNLENETMFVMLGLESPDNYENNIKREMRISEEQAKLITADINKEIFLPIRESLREMHKEELKDEEQEKNKQEPRVSGAERVRTFEPPKKIYSEPRIENRELRKDSFDRQKEQIPIGVSRQSLAEKEKEISQIGVSEPYDKLPRDLPKSEVSASAPAKRDILEEKLAGQARTPVEKVNLTEKGDEMEKKKPQSIDPYREPIE